MTHPFPTRRSSELRQKKVKADIHPDYIIRKEKRKHERMQELQHSFADDRGFTLSPLGVPETRKPKPSLTKVKASQLPAVPRKRSSITANVHTIDDNDDDYVLAVDDYVLPVDDDLPPIDDEGIGQTTFPTRNYPSSDATSIEEVEGDERNAKTQALTQGSSEVKSTAPTSHSNDADWSFLSTSKATSSSQPLTLLAEPLRLPPHPQTTMPSTMFQSPMMKTVPPQHQQQSLFMQYKQHIG